MTQPRKRFWLYAPYALVLAIVLLWTAFWFVVKDRVAAGLDSWIVKESQSGRDWRCEDRSIAGFPFRIEVKCASLALNRSSDPSAPSVTMGPILVVAQIYAPNHIIAEPKGPFTSTWSDGRKSILNWTTAQISLRRASGQLERGSLVLVQPLLTLAGFEVNNGTSRADRLEAHLRPTPGRAAEAAMDVALTVDKLAMAAIDQLFSSAAPSDIKIESTLTQAPSFIGGVTPVTVEAWRVASGELGFAKLALTKGAVQFEGQAKLSLDDLRRIRGRIDGSQTGIETLAGMRIGAMLDAGALLSGRPAMQTQGGRNLKPLPPLEARDGRLYLGPLRLPGQALRPLY